ncbi:MAG: nitronate monooxygenase [Bacteroidetes bacterium]|nr:nitronate monooxygenase [Bacteroidota bacterium]
MKELHIGELTIKFPIIQGGMAIGVSMSGLASSVANEGGLGVIAVAGLGMFEPDYLKNFVEANNRALRKEIQKARELTKGVIGVNIMVALSNFAELVKTSISEGIDIIFAGAGLPLDMPQYLTGKTKTKLVPIVSSGRAAKLLCSKWKGRYDYLPDAIVVEGPKAGGHLGFKRSQLDDPYFALEKLVTQVVEEVKYFEEKYNITIPVIAAGGIYTGADVKNIMDIGASGVQMGTRFVTTEECDASMKFKQTYIDAREEDLVIINSPVGMPGRAIRNEFIEKVNRGEKRPVKCPYHCLRTCNIETTPYCIVGVLVNGRKGNFNSGYAFAGANAYRTTKIISVKETIQSLVREYKEAKSLK